MDEDRNTDAKPDQARNGGATDKPDVPPPGTPPGTPLGTPPGTPPGTKDELAKAQEEAARERAENGGYQ